MKKSKNPEKEKYQKELCECEKYGSDKVDHLVVYFSGGGLGLITTFVRDSLPLLSFYSRFLFTLSIIFFVVALISEFISHYYSSHIARKTRDKLIDGDESYFDEKADKIIEGLNKFSLLFVIMGVLSTLLLVLSDVWGFSIIFIFN